MDIKKRLKQIRDIKKEVAQLRQCIADIKENMDCIRSSSNIGLTPASTGGKSDKVADLVCRLEEAEVNYMSKMLELQQEVAYIEGLIEGLDITERLLMRARYVEGMKWEEICCLINYEWAYTHRLHARALQKLA